MSCAYKKENQTKMVVCDLGNPMKAGTKVSDHMTASEGSGKRKVEVRMYESQCERIRHV